MTALPFPFYELSFNYGSQGVPHGDMVGYLNRRPFLILHSFFLSHTNMQEEIIEILSQDNVCMELFIQ